MADSQSMVVSSYEDYTVTRRMWGKSPCCGPDTLGVGGDKLEAGRQEQGGTGRGCGSGCKPGIRMPKSPHRDGKRLKGTCEGGEGGGQQERSQAQDTRELGGQQS